MSDDHVRSRLEDPLALAARLRRETPVASMATIPERAAADDAEPVYAPAARVPLRERVRAGDPAAELLLFRVGGDLFATDLLAVEEALELGEVHPVPGAPPAMLGVLGLRGRLLAVYSPERALAHPVRRERADAYVLVLRLGDAGGRPLAIVVDDVEDVHTADLREMQDLADVESPDGASLTGGGDEASQSVVLGVLRWREELVALVDADALALACAAGGEDTGRQRPARETR